MPANSLQIADLHTRPITKPDFDAIVQVVDHWWDGPIAVLAHPIFFYELGRHARVVEDRTEGDRLVGFLLGFVTADGDPARPPTGYIHLVGIDPLYRRRGVGRALYLGFMDGCRRTNVHRIKAITTAGNEGSMQFHLALEFQAHEEPDYAGPGRRRVVFSRDL